MNLRNILDDIRHKTVSPVNDEKPVEPVKDKPEPTKEQSKDKTPETRQRQGVGFTDTKQPQPPTFQPKTKIQDKLSFSSKHK